MKMMALEQAKVLYYIARDKLEGRVKNFIYMLIGVFGVLNFSHQTT
jgi:hypothetical protein